MGPEVVPLDAAWPVDRDSIGPKAVSLVRMSRAGLSVPGGFCVTERVLREHPERNKLTGRLKSLVEKISEAGPEARGALLSNLRQVIAEAPLAEQVRRQIEDHYHRLGADRVAVRSSGTAEDLADHSFAGQHDSYLGIASLEDCVEAVKKCWASLWTLRAYDIRQEASVHSKRERIGGRSPHWTRPSNFADSGQKANEAAGTCSCTGTAIIAAARLNCTTGAGSRPLTTS